jgi:hypothetical protein
VVTESIDWNDNNCDGKQIIIACVEELVIIEKILTHQNEKVVPVQGPTLPNSWAKSPTLRLVADCWA